MVQIETAHEAGATSCKLFIGGLAHSTTEDSLTSFYKNFGEIFDVVIMRDAGTNRSRGFAFITYKDSASVDNAQAARPHVIDGKTVDSKRALGRSNTPKAATGNSGRKIFVGGLKDIHDEEGLGQHFKQFGDLLDVKILFDKVTGRKRGFSYVEFRDYDSADKAVLHKNHVIKTIPVDVKKSYYKEERDKRLAAAQQAEGKIAEGRSGEQPPPVSGAAASGAPAPGAYALPGYLSAYGYPPVAGYNGWGAPSPYYGPQPAAPLAYGPAPPAWNGWGGYSVPPQGTFTLALAAAAAAARNGWDNGAPPATQNFGSYGQAFYRGTQKIGKFQSNRNNPYRP